ncbi:hypothetical protein [Chryseobacterium sp. MYb328]|uniref:hypothetical protein n=1 Tax=Chryseobacterium sp. MYb328 TaxID=2745231 RepID=UPI0030A86DD4
MINKDKIIWGVFMGALAILPILFIDFLWIQDTNDIEETYTTPDPELGLMYISLALFFIIPIFYLKVFTAKNKIPLLIIIGLGLLWALTNLYFLFNYKHIELYSCSFILISMLNIISFQKVKTIIWNVIGLFLILLFIGMVFYQFYITSIH